MLSFKYGNIVVGNEQSVNQDIIVSNTDPNFSFIKTGNLHGGIIRPIKRKNVQTCSKVTKLCSVSIHLACPVFVWCDGEMAQKL